ncbi:MAG: FxLYD domain-containing protein [Methanoregula sp.]|nr:FxLYD domain-containing protein [Methanoregula sp.]
MKIVVPVSVLVIALVFLSGCTSTPAVRDQTEGALHAHYEYTEGWSPGQGCYERVTGYVYNTGDVSVDAVRLTFNLVNTGTGTIRDSRSVYIGSVGPGNTTSYETVLDGECTQEYRVDFSFWK